MLTISGLSYSQVTTALNAAFASASSSYHFMFSNCMHAVAAGLESIGIYSGAPGFRPNERFYSIYYYHYNLKKRYE
jgi:hypothetical protein